MTSHHVPHGQRALCLLSTLRTHLPCPPLQHDTLRYNIYARRMSRDQRLDDNWALLYAAEKARENDQQVAVAFNLVRWRLVVGSGRFQEAMGRLGRARGRAYTVHVYRCPRSCGRGTGEYTGQGEGQVQRCAILLPRA